MNLFTSTIKSFSRQCITTFIILNVINSESCHQYYKTSSSTTATIRTAMAFTFSLNSMNIASKEIRGRSRSCGSTFYHDTYGTINHLDCKNNHVITQSRNLMGSYANRRIDVSVSMVATTVSASDSEQEMEEYKNVQDNEEESEYHLLMNFIDMIDGTPFREIDSSDIALLPNVLKDLVLLSNTSAVSMEEEYNEKIDEHLLLEIAQTVQRMLIRIVDEWKEATSNDEEAVITPDAGLFNLAIDAWINAIDSHDFDVLEQVDVIYSEMEDLYSIGLDTAMPNHLTFDNIFRVLYRYSYKKYRGIEDRAAWYFQRMTNLGLKPTVNTYTNLITIIARGRNKSAAHRAETLLRQAVSDLAPRAGSDEGDFPVETFNVVLAAWAKSDDEEASSMIEGILSLMDEYAIKPNIRSFTIYIDSFAQISDWQSVSKSDRILSRLVDLYLAGELDFEPDVACWTTVIRGWMRLAQKGRRKAEEKADSLLKRMVSLHEQGKMTVKPDAIVYFSVLNAYAYSDGDGSIQRANQIFSLMDKLYEKGDETMKPSVQTIKVLVDSWIKSDEINKMDRAENLLKRMEQLHGGSDDPKIGEIYRSILFGWTKSGNPIKADEYLRRMIEKRMLPDSFCFDKVIESYTAVGNIGSIKRAYEVFELMEKCHKNAELKPNERVYTQIIRTLTKEGAKGMAAKSKIILDRMHTLFKSGNKGIKPTVFTYNAVLNACAASVHLDDDEKAKSFDLAIRLFNELQASKEKPDHVTYGTLLRCAVLLPEGDKRNKMVIASFQKCIEAGYFNTYVLRDLQNCAPESLWRKMLRAPEGEVNFDRIPTNWSASCKQRPAKDSRDNRR